ncbi:uncharacterized protein LOC100179828 isoform X2 [Ciona intestinalis]
MCIRDQVKTVKMFINFVRLIVLLTLSCVVECQLPESFENVLTACCYQGKQFALSHDSCHGIPVTVTSYTQICAVAQEKCCLEAEEQETCNRGVATARSMAVCDAPTSIRGQCEQDGFKSCCDCCALGLKAYGLSLSCSMEILGEPCNSAYSECCRTGPLTTQPGDTPETSTSTAKSTRLNTTPATEFTGPRCATNNVCDHTCTDTRTGIQCSCREGYTLEDDSVTCSDINECVLATHSCVEGQICFNTLGSFTCQRLISCGTGYELTDRNTCDDIDECQLNIDNCGDKLNCINIRGSFRCVAKSCDAGYFTDAVGGCIDIDECRSGDYTCPSGTHCRNTQGSYVCDCPDGYVLSSDQQSCEDIDECILGAHECADGETCVNTEGSFNCIQRPSLTCTAGYEISDDGESCIDVNECDRGTHTCSSGSTCINEEGSFRCQDPIICTPGTRPSSNQRSCIDIDECEDPLIHQCGVGARCVNVPGSFRCECNRGYRTTFQGSRTRCQDINECALAAGERCMYRCRNSPGSYSCVCPSGYNLERFDGTCTDIDECNTNQHNCSRSETCFNTRGSFKCVEITCPAHYARLSNRQSRVKCIRKTCNPITCPQVSYLHIHVMLPSMYRLRHSETLLRLFMSRQASAIVVRIVRGNEAGKFGIQNYGNRATLDLEHPIVGPWSTVLYLQASESSLGGGKELWMAVAYVYVSEYSF